MNSFPRQSRLAMARDKSVSFPMNSIGLRSLASLASKFGELPQVPVSEVER